MQRDLWYILAGLAIGGGVGAALGFAVDSALPDISMPFVLAAIGSYLGMLAGNHKRLQVLRDARLAASEGAHAAGGTKRRDRERQASTSRRQRGSRSR